MKQAAVIAMLTGSMRELRIGDPALLESDVGPIIDRNSADELRAHLARMQSEARLLYTHEPRDVPAAGNFFPLCLVELDDIDAFDLVAATRLEGGDLLIVNDSSGDVEVSGVDGSVRVEVDSSGDLEFTDVGQLPGVDRLAGRLAHLGGTHKGAHALVLGALLAHGRQLRPSHVTNRQSRVLERREATFQCREVVLARPIFVARGSDAEQPSSL